MADNDDLLNAINNLASINQRIANSGGKVSGDDQKKMKDLEKIIAKLSGSYKKNKNAVDLNTDATEDNTDKTLKFAKGVAGAVSNIGNFGIGLANAADAVREQRENFTSLNPAIRMVGGALERTSGLAGGALEAFGTMADGIPIIGGLLKGVGQLTTAVGKAAAEVAVQIGEKVTSEMQNASDAMRMAGQSGALGAQGITGLANQAISAGISFKDFAGVIKESAHGLAFAFGDSATGAQQLANISKDMTPFRRELTALGIGAKQQVEMTANYLKLQARTGRLESRSSADLAQGSANYAKQLTTLSRLTGKSVEEQEKELDNQMRNVRMAAAVSDIQAQYGPKAADAMRNTAAAISGIDENIGKGLQDALAGNLGTDAAQEFQLAAGEMGAQAVDLLRKGAISTEEATAMISKGVENQAAALGGPKTIGAIAGMGTAFDNVLPGMLKFQNRVNLSADEITELGRKQAEVAKGQDAATKGIVDGQIQMQKFATEMDKISIKMLPAMGTAVTTLTTGMLAAAKETAKMIQMGPEAYAKSLMGIKDVDMKVVDAQDARNQEKQSGGQKVISTISSWFEKSVGLISDDYAANMKADRIAKETGILKARGGVDVSDKYQSQFGTQVDANASNTKKRDEMRAKIRGGTSSLGTAGMVTPNAGPAGGYTSADFGSAVNQNISSSAITQGGGAAAASENNKLGETQINRLDQLISQMSRSNDTNEKILQAAHRS